jgi:hypothetical protein
VRVQYLVHSDCAMNMTEKQNQLPGKVRGRERERAADTMPLEVSERETILCYDSQWRNRHHAYVSMRSLLNGHQIEGNQYTVHGEGSL